MKARSTAGASTVGRKFTRVAKRSTFNPGSLGCNQSPTLRGECLRGRGREQ